MHGLVTWLLLSNILGESKLISWLGLLRKCLQTSESSHVPCSLKRVMRLRLVWPMYVRQHLTNVIRIDDLYMKIVCQ